MASSMAPSGTTTTYGYDGAGNRTSVKFGTGNPVTTSYDLAGLPTTSSDNINYTHDAIRELTKIDKPGGTANDWNLVYSGCPEDRGPQDHRHPRRRLHHRCPGSVLSRVASSITTTYTYRGTGEDAAKSQVGTATSVFSAFTPGGPLARRTGTDATPPPFGTS
jgi:YD repeat-containing protein